MQEIWKDIAGYEGLYQISDLGNVKSLNYNHTGRAKLLSVKNHHTGYKMVMLCKDGKHTNKTVHSLVANAFIPKESENLYVNHIDGNKANNTVSNLEWVSPSGNTQHAIKTGLRADSNMTGRKGKLNPLSKPVLEFDKFGNLIKRWDCISDAARFYNGRPCTIINACAGRIKTYKNHIWKREGE